MAFCSGSVKSSSAVCSATSRPPLGAAFATTVTSAVAPAIAAPTAVALNVYCDPGVREFGAIVRASLVTPLSASEIKTEVFMSPATTDQTTPKHVYAEVVALEVGSK